MNATHPREERESSPREKPSRGTHHQFPLHHSGTLVGSNATPAGTQNSEASLAVNLVAAAFVPGGPSTTTFVPRLLNGRRRNKA